MKLNIPCEDPIEPECRHFRICGGCRFQHIPYDEQLAHKEAFVSTCFDRQVEPIIASHSAWRYRNKMEFSFSQSMRGEKFLGLMQKKGRVENLQECFLTHPWFIEILKNVRAWWEDSSVRAYFPPANAGLLRTLTLREGCRTGEKMVMLTISEEYFPDSDLIDFIECLPPLHSLILRKQITAKKMPTRFEEKVLVGKDHITEILYHATGQSYQFRVRGASFFQPNTLQAELIYQKAIACAQLNQNDRIFDLYCGTGSLGIFASSHAAQIRGIEIIPEAVQDAHYNLKINAISNMEVFEGDVQEQLKTLDFLPTTVFIDPPRVGLGSKTINHLLTILPQKMIYVSCNPVSQAEDCKALVEYTVEYLQPIDQFPHTDHVENIALLRRKT